MGANAQTSVPAFTSGQVLTAAQVTGINTGIPVFASSTERDAAFGGTGEKTLAEGQMAYLEDTNETQYYDGSTWAAVGAGGGLTFISRTTVGSAVSSVTVSGAFSSTYDNYRIVIASVDLTVNDSVGIRLSALSTGYKFSGLDVYYSGTVAGGGTTTGTDLRIGALGTNKGSISIDLYGPNLAAPTMLTSLGHYGHPTLGGVTSYAGVETSSTQHTAFTLLPSSGTMTGGTIDVYGYAKA